MPRASSDRSVGLLLSSDAGEHGLEARAARYRQRARQPAGRHGTDARQSCRRRNQTRRRSTSSSFRISMAITSAGCEPPMARSLTPMPRSRCRRRNGRSGRTTAIMGRAPQNQQADIPEHPAHCRFDRRQGHQIRMGQARSRPASRRSTPMATRPAIPRSSSPRVLERRCRSGRRHRGLRPTLRHQSRAGMPAATWTAPGGTDATQALRHACGRPHGGLGLSLRRSRRSATWRRRQRLPAHSGELESVAVRTIRAARRSASHRQTARPWPRDPGAMRAAIKAMGPELQVPRLPGERHRSTEISGANRSAGA